MKINRFIFALAAAATIACGKERVESSADGREDGMRPITFATKLTRGDMVDTPALLAEKGGFNVWAIGHTGKWDPAAGGTPLLDAAVVKSTDRGATWSYTNPADWPADGRYVSFFAYGPANAASFMLDSRGKTPRIDFAVADIVANQVDLTVAAPLYDQFGPDYGNRQSVNLQFQHALARIHFSAILDQATTANVKVKSVTLTGLYGLGIAKLPFDNQKNPSIEWTIDTSLKSSYTVSIGDGLQDVFVGTASTEISTGKGMMFMIPQTIQRAANPPAMEVVMEVDGKDAAYSVPLFSPAAWEAGKSYNYQILAQANGIKLIVIDSGTELADWASAIMIQSVIMTGNAMNPGIDIAKFHTALENLNYMKRDENVGKYSWFDYKWVGLYATRDISHDITLDVTPALTTNFNKGDCIIFDFKKVVGEWKESGPGNPYAVTVNYDHDVWELAPAFQTPDGFTGATLPCDYTKDKDGNTIPSVRKELQNVITDRGTIILKKK